MKSWRKSYALSENTEWNRAISIMSLEVIFAWTKYRRQYSPLSFHIWKSGPPRGAPLRIFPPGIRCGWDGWKDHFPQRTPLAPWPERSLPLILTCHLRTDAGRVAA